MGGSGARVWLDAPGFVHFGREGGGRFVVLASLERGVGSEGVETGGGDYCVF